MTNKKSLLSSVQKVLLVVGVLASSLAFASEGEILYKACAGCHGINGEKKALGKSEIIKAWDSEKTIKALSGYKDGSYGKAMKGVMKGQAVRLDESKIKKLADYISKMK